MRKCMIRLLSEVPTNKSWSSSRSSAEILWSWWCQLALFGLLMASRAAGLISLWSSSPCWAAAAPFGFLLWPLPPLRFGLFAESLFEESYGDATCFCWRGGCCAPCILYYFCWFIYCLIMIVSIGYPRLSLLVLPFCCDYDVLHCLALKVTCLYKRKCGSEQRKVLTFGVKFGYLSRSKRWSVWESYY